MVILPHNTDTSVHGAIGYWNERDEHRQGHCKHRIQRFVVRLPNTAVRRTIHRVDCADFIRQVHISHHRVEEQEMMAPQITDKEYLVASICIATGKVLCRWFYNDISILLHRWRRRHATTR